MRNQKTLTSVLCLSLFVALTMTAWTALACGDEPPAGEPSFYIVRVQTKVGTRCGRLWSHGPFKTYEAADRFMKAREKKAPGTPEAPTEYRVEAVFPVK